MKKVLLVLIIASQSPLLAQRFHSGVLAGGNLAQIDGDLVYGYHRLGWHGGVYVGTKISKLCDLDMQLLYSTRGSRSTPEDPHFIRIRLHYIDLPVIFTVKDWENQDEDGSYYRMHFYGGLSVGRLVKSSSEKNYHEQFKPIDLSWLAGFKYFLNRNIAAHGRYTRSIIPMYKYTFNNTNYGMISYFISLGLVYHFD